MPTPAEALYRIVTPVKGAPPASDLQSQQAVIAFGQLLTSLEKKHASRQYSDDYLIGQVFKRSPHFKNEVESVAYCRCNLKVAVRQFGRLIKAMQGPNGITTDLLQNFSSFVIDFIFDLIGIVTFLERKTPGFQFFNGGKSRNVHSWQVYLLSRGLIYHSAMQPPQPIFEHRMAQIAGLFVLRQSLELRFERIIGVSPRDSKMQSPRLGHGFHQEFIQAHPEFFDCKGFSIADIRRVYDWCSEIVHQAYQPYTWQITWALELSEQILSPRAAPTGGAWNIANSVEIIDADEMQAAFEEHFLSSYDHGSWRLLRQKPEALTRNWIARPDPDFFMPVRKRQTIISCLSGRLKRFFRPRR